MEDSTFTNKTTEQFMEDLNNTIDNTKENIMELVSYQTEKNLRNFGFDIRYNRGAEILKVFTQVEPTTYYPNWTIGVALCYISKGDYGEYVVWNISRDGGNENDNGGNTYAEDNEAFAASNGGYYMLTANNRLEMLVEAEEYFGERVKATFKPHWDSQLQTARKWV